MYIIRSNGGFSTIVAVLLTGFLIVLSAGVLFLFLSESQINRTLYDGISSYHAAEWSMEYALLKIKNHREGFGDDLDFTSDDGKMFVRAGDRRAPQISYSLSGVAQTHTWVIAAQQFEIIPLFYEAGKVLTQTNGKPWKDPRKPTATDGFEDYKGTAEFSLKVSDAVVWNIIGNDVSGKTFGLSGKWDSSRVIGASADPAINLGMTHTGSIKKYSAGELSESTLEIKKFLEDYRESYLVIYNPSDVSLNYTIAAPTLFSLPNSRIVASSKIKNSIVNLELTEDKSKLFDALKYSLFVK